MPRIRVTPEDRIERYIVRPDDPDACWEWTGSTALGYGIISAIRDGAQIAERAHRVAYRKYIGAIPTGLWVLHRCDNPPCTNPRHLFLGTASDNTRDAVIKGRHPTTDRGQWCLRYTDVQVAEMRGLALGGVSRRSIMAQFGISASLLCAYINGYERRNGRPRPPLVGRQRGECSGRAKLTAANVAEIRVLLAEGHRQKDIADRFSISRPVISRIAKGRIWREAVDAAA